MMFWAANIRKAFKKQHGRWLFSNSFSCLSIAGARLQAAPQLTADATWLYAKQVTGWL